MEGIAGHRHTARGSHGATLFWEVTMTARFQELGPMAPSRDAGTGEQAQGRPVVTGPVGIGRGAPRVGPKIGPGRFTLPRWVLRLLRVPLAVKLAGANALLVIGPFLGWLLVDGQMMSAPQVAGVVALALLVGVIINVTLVRVALWPLNDLEATAARVWRGDLTARVPRSPLADPEMGRVGAAINLLLERLIADRTRVRQLAQQVIEAGHVERSRIARELHDSTAQTLAALQYQIQAALDAAADDETRNRLEMVRDLAVNAVTEVRTLSHTVHPRVLDDLGVVAALEALARRTREQEGIEASVSLTGDAAAIPPSLGSALYAIAREAVANSVKHGAPASIRITLAVRGSEARLEVSDDGDGFDGAEALMRRPGTGLFSMAERAALADGYLAIDSAPGRGTSVAAVVPLTGVDNQWAAA